MFLCSNTAKVACLLLLSSQTAFLHAESVAQAQTSATNMGNDLSENGLMASSETTGITPPPPPGPYFSSAMVKAAQEKETETSQPIQMPASLPVSEHSEASVKSVAKVAMQTFSPDIAWPDDSASNKQAAGMPNIAPTNSAYRNNLNPRAQWPRQVRQNSRWTPAPPAPPGPYGFVPNYIPRSVVNSDNRFGYNGPYNPARNTYGMPYGNPGQMPGAVYPQMRNPGYSNPGYLYGHPGQGFNQGSFNQGDPNQSGFNQGGFNQKLNQNNLNQSDTNQGSTK